MIEERAVLSAISLVAEQSFFAWTEPAPPGAAIAGTGVWWQASVAFEGPLAGRLTFALPDALARQLHASFLGLDPDEPIAEAALEDCLGEFANMSCGAWLTSLEQDRCFVLQRPTVQRLDAGPECGAAAVVMVNDAPVVVHSSLG